MAKGGSIVIKIDGDDGGLRAKLKGIAKVAQGTVTAIKGVAIASGAIATAFGAAGVASVKYNAEIEQLQTSFEVMTGSATKAANIVERLRDLGASTPYDFMGLAGTVQALMQYNLSSDEAIQTTEMIGDIAQGSAEKMGRIAMAYGQMSSAGKVQLEDIKQMIEAGFNPLLEISERTGESMESLYDRISKGTISVDEITGAMISATSEGGKFFQSMEKQSQALNGQLSTIKDNLQALGGSVFSEVSENLRTSILPGANELLSRMQEAFDLHGIDGLVWEITEQIPKLTTAAVNMATSVIKNVSSKLPALVRSLGPTIVTAIKSISTLAPQFADTFFDMGSEAVSMLVDRMPEWGPALLEGAGKLALNVGKGLLSIVGSALIGLVDLVNKSSEDIWAGLYDQEKVAKMAASVTGTVDVTGAKNAINAATLELDAALADLYAVLTNGSIEDDDTKTLQQRLDEAYNGDVETINTWLSGKIGELDTDTTTYAANVAALKQEAQGYKAELQLLYQQASALVVSMAGQPTAVVQAKLAEFESLMARIDELQGKLNEANVAAQNLYLKSYERVRAGASTDNSDVVNALEYAYSNFKINQKAIEDAAAAAKAEADAAWDAGLKTEEDNAAHLDTLKEIEEKRAAEMQQLETSYASQLSELLKGLGEAFAITEPEAMQQIGTIADKLNIVAKFDEILSGWDPESPESIETAKSKIKALIESITGEEVMPSDLTFPAIEGFVKNFEDSINDDLANLSISAEDGKNPVLAAFEGMFQSAAFTDLEIDTSTLEAKISTIMNGVGSNAGAGIGAGAAAYDFSGDTDTVASNFESDAKTSFDSHSPSRKMKPLGSDVAAGIGAGAAEFDFSGYASTMASNMESAIGNSLLNAGMRAGKSFSSGLSTGIYAGKSGVIQAAINVAQAAIDAANQTLEINSPSKATMRSGRSFGEGFAMGIQESMATAVTVARRMSGELLTAASIGNTMQVRVPDMQQTIEYAIEATQQPVSLFVNGRELARVTASDTQQAHNWHNRRIAMGVGK